MRPASSSSTSPSRSETWGQWATTTSVGTPASRATHLSVVRAGPSVARTSVAASRIRVAVASSRPSRPLSRPEAARSPPSPTVPPSCTPPILRGPRGGRVLDEPRGHGSTPRPLASTVQRSRSTSRRLRRLYESEESSPMEHPPTLPPALMASPASTLDPTQNMFQLLLKERIVFLGSEVNDQVANYLTAQMLYLEGEDPDKDIWLYINSPGGSVTAGMAIYDTMQFIQPDVATICMGLGASMGQFLLCAGAAGKRFSLPHAADHDAPAPRWHPGSGVRHRDPGRADDLHQAAHGREDRRAHRPDRRADRAGLRARPLVHRRAGARTTA